VVTNVGGSNNGSGIKALICITVSTFVGNLLCLADTKVRYGTK
jgi:hypothetical protein